MSRFFPIAIIITSTVLSLASGCLPLIVMAAVVNTLIGNQMTKQVK